ncbi:twin-arginine translocase subunit TatC [Halosimplex sp. J119]
MTDERPGDADDDEEAAGPHDERGDDSSDRSDPLTDRRTGGLPDDSSADDDSDDTDDSSDDADDTTDDPSASDGDDDSHDESPDPVWTDDHPDNRPDDAGPGSAAAETGSPPDSGGDAGAGEHSAATVDDEESDAAADGGSGASTEFGGDINPHANPSTGGPAEGAPPAPEDVGAPDDQEMPLAQHIEEMVRRLGVVVVVMALVSGLAFPFADRMINFLWYSFLPGSASACPTTATSADAACPYLFHPLALMFARLKVASLVGFIVALPVTVYESYLFMRPGLYPRERRYYLASVPTSLVLAFVGVFFAYLLVLPTLFAYFTGYTGQAAEITFSLTETFNLIVMMLGFFALVFQIPLLIMLAVMMGVTSRRWLAARRIYFWGGFATVAFLFSPDPTGMAPILVAATMILLFEGTLLLLYWTGEATAVEAADLAARRPFVWLAAVVAGYAVSTAPLPSGYYDQLPAEVTSALAEFGVTQMTPLLIGLSLIALYEAALYLARRARRTGRAYRTFARARVAVWPLSLAIGYLGSPDPVLLQRIDAVDLSTAESAGVVVGLILAFEATVAALDWYQRRE